MYFTNGLNEITHMENSIPLPYSFHTVTRRPQKGENNLYQYVF